MPSVAQIIAHIKSSATVAQARKQVDTDPTPAMAAAGNYKTGKCELHGIKISLENPKGSTRRGVDPDGKAWSQVMKWDYGYFTGTKAADGDAVDVFIGPNHKSELVFAVDQMVGDKFDESKFLMGFDSQEDAEKGYLDHYPKGWKLGEVSSCTVNQLKQWLGEGAHTRAFAGQNLKAAAHGRVHGVTGPIDFKSWVAATRARGDTEDTTAAAREPLYDWDGTIIPRLPGNARAYREGLDKLTDADLTTHGRDASQLPGPIDLATSRPDLFHQKIRDTAARLGIAIRDIHHAPGDKLDVIRRLRRPLLDDDDGIVAGIHADPDLGEDFAQKAAHTATKGCLMLQMPERLCKRIREFKKEHIPADQIVDDEDEFHTTLLYGFKDGVRAEDLLEYLESGPMKVGLGKLKRFPANEKRPDSDVIVISAHGWKIGNSDQPLDEKDELHALNSKLADAFDVKSDWKYNPHVTLCYCKPGALKDLVEGGESSAGAAPFDDEEYPCHEMIYSCGVPGEKDRDKTTISLVSLKGTKQHVHTYCTACKKMQSCRCRGPKPIALANSCYTCEKEEEKVAMLRPDKWERLCARRGECPDCRHREMQAYIKEGMPNGLEAPTYGGCTCAEETKSAAEMVRKKRVVEEFDDHCPHCDHKFREKGYPRPLRPAGMSDEEWRNAVMNDELDDICPNCNGIVDTPEQTDEQIESYRSWGDSIVEDSYARREKKRKRIAERARSKSKSAALLDFTDPEDRPTILPMEKWASAEVAIPRTGPEAIAAFLGRLNLDQIEESAKADIASKRVTKRGRAVKLLNLTSGLRRNNLQPTDMMIKRVPVIPPAFRPFNLIGDTFMPGDANELYKDLLDSLSEHKKVSKVLGPEGARDEWKAVMQATRAVHGYADSPNPKTTARGVHGFLKKITGAHGPKTSYIHRRMLSKTQDGVGRGVIIPDPDLSMDEIGIPEEQAWTTYADYIQRNLVRAGMGPADALKQVTTRTPFARKALEAEMARRPIVYSRSPAWYRFNVIAGRPRMVEGDAIRISPFVTTGLGADFDGDTSNFHVQATDAGIKDAYEKLLPSKMLWSIGDREKVIPVVKHEQVLQMFHSSVKPSAQTHRFGTHEEAMEAIRGGKVPLEDEIEIGPPQPAPIPPASPVQTPLPQPAAA